MRGGGQVAASFVPLLDEALPTILTHLPLFTAHTHPSAAIIMAKPVRLQQQQQQPDDALIKEATAVLLEFLEVAVHQVL